MERVKVVLAVFIAAGILAGCAGKGRTSAFEPKNSGIFVSDSGIFTTATIEKYENRDYYNEEEWKTFLEENVTAYNAEHGEGAVTLQSCSLKDGVASMIFDYATGSDLAQFTALYKDTVNQVDSIGLITVDEALKEAETQGTLFIKTVNGRTASADEIAEMADCRVVVVQGKSVKIHTESKIMYTSDGVSMENSCAADTAQGTNYIIFK